ncbi:MAG TPA: sugar kinase [Candidatus Limnocylindrales bacterium]|nr:sugar kinase [Candidatus Limnocylindrales bacterium]
MHEDRRADVVTVGECLMSFVATTPGPLAQASLFERHVAGAEANVAVGLARSGHSVAYVGRVGDDGFGKAIVRTLRGEGIDVTHLAVDPDARTGVMFRERRILGAMDVVYHRAGSAGSRLTAEDVERVNADGFFAEARWLHLTGITPALSSSARAATEHAMELARGAGATVSLDINLRRRLWSEDEAEPVLRELASRADVVLGSADELALLAGMDADRDPEQLAGAVTRLGPPTVVAKLAADGALGLEAGGTPVREPAFPVPMVVDPVGAGDAFCAGFIAGRLDGADLATALRMGNACGALAVVVSGDQAGLPDRAELDRFLAGGPDTIR